MATAAGVIDSGIGAGPVGGPEAEGPAADMLLMIVNGARAWSSFEELSDALGVGDDAARAAIRAAEALGWAAYWAECPQGPSYTLSVEAADRLAVAIGPDGRWHRATSPAADGNYRPGRAPHRRAGPGAGDEGEEEAGALGWAVDPRAVDPAEAAAEAERLRLLAANPHVRRLLYGTAPPLIVLGLRPPWPAPIEGGICPGCGTGPTDPDTTCVICDRGGLDRSKRGGRGR